MVDTPRTLAYLLASVFQDGQTGGINANDMRDLCVSIAALAAPGTQAQRVGDFLNSLGVNSGMSGFITADIDTATIITRLKFIGATAVRARLSSDTFVLGLFSALVANGIGLCLISPTQGDTPTLIVANCVTAAVSARCNGTNSLIAVEQANEPDVTNYTYSAVTSSSTVSPGFLPVASFSAANYIGLKGNAFLANVPVVHVSHGGADPLDNGLQFLSVPYGYSHVTLTTNATTAAANATLHFASTTGVAAGLFIYGTNIAGGATVSSFTSTTVVMSAAALTGGVASGASIRFGARVADNTVFSDIANTHVYPMSGANFGSGVVFSGQTVDPALAGGGDFFANALSWNYITPVTSAGWNGLTLAQATALPRWVTECGYATAGITAGGIAVTPAVAGKNILTAWLNAWQAGYSKFFVYNLYDDAASTTTAAFSFGLYSWTTGPLVETAKAAATYLHNFTTILADASPQRNTFSAGAISYSLTSLPASGKSMLFQASSGVFYLVIWNQVNNWNVAVGSAIVVSGTSVTVTFTRAGTISVYDPTIGTAVQSTASSNTIAITLSDYPMIVSFI